MSRGLGKVELQIINALARGDLRPIEIANIIGDVLLPSVRRALASLSRKGIAECDQRRWRLTAAHRKVTAKLINADCRKALRDLIRRGIEVNAVITDPPYGIGVRGERWDSDGIAFDPQVWKLCLKLLPPGGHLLAFGHCRKFHKLVTAIEAAGFEIKDTLAWIHAQGWPKKPDVLKPAMELICLARRPVAELSATEEKRSKNKRVGLNIDATRVGVEGGTGKVLRVGKLNRPGRWGTRRVLAYDDTQRGRHPANVIHDGVLGLPFFFCAKPSPRERVHPTQKPLALMRWLVRLVVPPGGLVLDPFAGSGTTGRAAKLEGCNFIGIEAAAEYTVTQALVRTASPARNLH